MIFRTKIIHIDLNDSSIIKDIIKSKEFSVLKTLINICLNEFMNNKLLNIKTNAMSFILYAFITMQILSV